MKLGTLIKHDEIMCRNHKKYFDTISCPLYNLKTVKDFSIKLSTLIKHDQTMCHAQEP